MGGLVPQSLKNKINFLLTTFAYGADPHIYVLHISIFHTLSRTCYHTLSTLIKPQTRGFLGPCGKIIIFRPYLRWSDKRCSTKWFLVIRIDEDLWINMLTQQLGFRYVCGVAWRGPQGPWLNWRAGLFVWQLNRQMFKAGVNAAGFMAVWIPFVFLHKPDVPRHIGQLICIYVCLSF